MKIILFGASNPSGSAFLELNSNQSMETWGRRPVDLERYPHVYCDLSVNQFDHQQPMEGVLVSFAPIWLLSSFLTNLQQNHPEIISGLQGIIACSSSSYLTKRFAFNDFDKNLSFRLHNSHLILEKVCNSLGIPFQILAPTLVYGKVNKYSDKNLSKIMKILRALPIIVLPQTTGLRQPIHAIQLAKAMKHYSDQIISGTHKPTDSGILPLGGDATLTYENMILQMRNATDPKDPAKKCRILKISNQLFYVLSSPILIFNPKLFESILRIQSNLSGFNEVHMITNELPDKFPISDNLNHTHESLI